MRERLYLREAEAHEYLALVEDKLQECLVLSTCNRTEIYGVTTSSDLNVDHFKDLLIDYKGVRGMIRDEHFFSLISCAACQQLFSVATSIDSQIVGDLQILRQLRSSYSLARERGTTGKVLNQLLQRAFKIGKLTFTETSIHEGAVSVSLAAVEMATEVFGTLRGKKVLVLGAGETARLTSEALLNKRVGALIVSNRTRRNAEQMIDSLGETSTTASVIDFEEFREHLNEIDILISSTGSSLPILDADDFTNLEKKILAIDIAVPRDIHVSVGELPNVILKNIDDLKSMVSFNRERRLREELPKVKKLIAQEMFDFLPWYYALPLMPAYAKTGCKPPAEQTSEILRIKQFLNENASEMHKLYMTSKGDFREDLENHVALVKRLQSLKEQAFGQTSV